MRNEAKERWKELCEQAVVEQDHDKFLAIITELNEVLEEKEQRLKAAQNRSREAPRPPSP
ncbi:MAG TPA: hypothetical protein VGS27_35080 [Candidatus Sulfotelmatobacter sp.]|nr:hypothetical protein [Candidatus Sulfotelmatobacter sp.]